MHLINRLLLLLALCVFAATPAMADEYLVTETGNWTSSCPSPICAANGDEWMRSFMFDSSQAPVNPVLNDYFGEASTNENLYDNGTLVESGGAGLEYFLNPSRNGFLALLSDAPVVGTIEAQSFVLTPLYEGSEFAPVILPGVYTDVAPNIGDVNINTWPTGSTGVITITDLTTAASVPEPSTVALTLTGLGLLGMGLRRAKASDVFPDSRVDRSST